MSPRRDYTLVVALWHITTAAESAAAQARGSYRSATFAEEGFIHLSTARQWLATANRFYRGRTDLVRLAIDETLLRAPLRFEPADGDWFPHLYGELELTAVHEVIPLTPNADGAFLPSVPPAYADFANRVTTWAASRPDVLGVLATGSWADGTLDAHSDLDLRLLAADPEPLWRDRTRWLASWGELLVHFSGEHVGEPRLVLALFDAPLLHVDVKLVTHAGLAGQGRSHALWLDRDGSVRAALEVAAPRTSTEDEWQRIEERFWIWIHYGARKVARGELLEALDHVGFVRVRALGTLIALVRGAPPRGMRSVERDHPRFAARARSTVVARPERDELIRALRACVEVYRELRSAAPSTLVPRHAAESAVVAALDAL